MHFHITRAIARLCTLDNSRHTIHLYRPPLIFVLHNTIASGPVLPHSPLVHSFLIPPLGFPILPVAIHAIGLCGLEVILLRWLRLVLLAEEAEETLLGRGFADFDVPVRGLLLAHLEAAIWTGLLIRLLGGMCEGRVR
jgi:hypothetical protein